MEAVYSDRICLQRPHLRADQFLTDRRVTDLTPRLVRAAFERWKTQGASPSVIAGRFRVLRSAIGWAYDERIIDDHPLRSMRGPGRVEPRRPIRDEDLAALLRTAEARVLEALANDHGNRAGLLRRHRAEQDLLLVRLAADSGARRGELTALRFDDLNQRVLTITRSVSGDVITTPSRGGPGPSPSAPPPLISGTPSKPSGINWPPGTSGRGCSAPTSNMSAA